MYAIRSYYAFYTWLYRIGVNTAKNYLVAQSRRAPTTTGYNSEEAETFDDGEQLRDINTPERLMMSRQIGETVETAMDALPRITSYNVCYTKLLRESKHHESIQAGHTPTRPRC